GHKHRSSSLSCPEPRRTGGYRVGKGPLGGPSIKEVEGFVVTKSGADSIQTTIFRQTTADRFDRLLRLFRDRFQFAIDIFIGYFDLLALGDFIEDQRCLHFTASGFTLAFTQASPIHLTHV